MDAIRDWYVFGCSIIITAENFHAYLVVNIRTLKAKGLCDNTGQTNYVGPLPHMNYAVKEYLHSDSNNLLCHSHLKACDCPCLWTQQKQLVQAWWCIMASSNSCNSSIATLVAGSTEII